MGWGWLANTVLCYLINGTRVIVKYCGPGYYLFNRTIEFTVNEL